MEKISTHKHELVQDCSESKIDLHGLLRNYTCFYKLSDDVKEHEISLILAEFDRKNEQKRVARTLNVICTATSMPLRTYTYLV